MGARGKRCMQQLHSAVRGHRRQAVYITGPRSHCSGATQYSACNFGMPPPVRKLRLEDNRILQCSGGIGAFRDASSIGEIKHEVESIKTLASIRELGAEGAADLQQYGYMLLELPGWLVDCLKTSAVARYIDKDAGGYSGMAELNGKRLFARPEPFDNTKRFDETAGALAAVARLVATALLSNRQSDVLTPSAIGVLRPVDGTYRHASVAHINIYSQGEDVGDSSGQPSAYSPHTDGGLLTLVTCPVSDRALVVQLPGGGEEHVPLEPGIAAVLPGEALGKDLHPCAAPRFAPPYRATRHHVDRGTVAGERASVTFHLRPHPDALLSDKQTAGEFMERFYGAVQRINAQRTAQAAAPAAAPAAARNPAASAAASAAAAPAVSLCGAAASSNIVLRVNIFVEPRQKVDVLVGLRQKVATVVKWCALQTGMPVEELRPLFKGERMSLYRSFQSYGMDEGDVIDVFKQQIGD